MAQRSIRFGIRDDNGNRAATWKLLTQTGKGKSDFYLVCRTLGAYLKTSFHQSGKWHIAYSKEAFEELGGAKITGSGDRFIEKWPRPKEIATGVTLAYRIVTPYSATTTTTSLGKYKKVIWIPNAPEPRATEIDILITTPTVTVPDWPGKRSMGTSLIGTVPLENGGTVWAVHWVVDMPDLSSIADGRLSFYKGKSKNDLDSDNLRALVFDEAPDGSRVIYDCAMKG